MTDRWQALEDLVQAALDRPPELRDLLLADLTADPELRAEALELAAAHERAGDFLERPAVHATRSDPGHIGPYRVLRRLGSGGMGDVYLATREPATAATSAAPVAVKVLAPGLGSRDLVRRFRAERQILARLDHPNIARLHDGGTHDDARPYLVLEYVEGVPLQRHCDEHRLDLRGRLQLVLAVCDAVDYAHRNLVLHLDLKPENVLVDRDGRVKLLDFGIAKLLDADPAAPGTRTRTGARPLSPQYASPEQRAGGPLTTASDIYSLGVVLHRLLAGGFPETEPGGPGDGEPRRPSATTPAPGLTGEDGRLHAELRRRMTGDLDAIVLRALRRAPEARYASVGQLADDLRRHLDGLPVLARRGTSRYLAGKLLRRHRGALLVASLALLLLIGFTVALALQAARLERERRKAETISMFLLDQLFHANLGRDDGEPDLGDVLDYGRSLLAQPHPYVDPDTDDALRVVLARQLRMIGRIDAAAPLLQRALEQRLQRHGDDHLDVAATLHELSYIDTAHHDYPAAERRLRRALQIRESALAPTDPDLAMTRLRLADAVHRQHGHGPASPYYDQAIAPLTAADTPREQLDLINLRLERAKRVLLFDGPEPALPEFEALLVPFDALELPQYPELAHILRDLGNVHYKLGQHAQSAAVFTRALRIFDTSPGVSPARRLPFMVGLARARLGLGDRAGFERTLLVALDLALARLGTRHPETRRIVDSLREAYSDNADARAALERRVARVAPPDP